MLARPDPNSHTLIRTLIWYNNRVNSDCQKQRGFRYVTATALLAAGYAKVIRDTMSRFYM